jgi:hypothetical protein
MPGGRTSSYFSTARDRPLVHAGAHDGDLVFEEGEPHGARFQLILPIMTTATATQSTMDPRHRVQSGAPLADPRPPPALASPVRRDGTKSSR